MARKYADQCASVGAAILYWNEADHLVDVFLCKCLRAPYYLWKEIAVRVDNAEQKVDLIRAVLTHDLGSAHPVYLEMDRLLGQYKGLKKHRDHLAHTAPSFEQNMGTSKQQRKFKTMNLTEADLLSTAEHMNHLVEDMMMAEDVFITLYGDDLDDSLAPVWFARDPKRPETQQDLQVCLDQVDHLHRNRRKLPPLPPIPK